jgi:hypothetical protein
VITLSPQAGLQALSQAIQAIFYKKSPFKALKQGKYDNVVTQLNRGIIRIFE